VFECGLFHDHGTEIHNVPLSPAKKAERARNRGVGARYHLSNGRPPEPSQATLVVFSRIWRGERDFSEYDCVPLFFCRFTHPGRKWRNPVKQLTQATGRRIMKKLIATALALLSLLAGTALTQSAAVAQTRRDAGQYYYQNGSQYYDGYPLRDWKNMRDGW
jgi:hypothetical protein